MSEATLKIVSKIIALFFIFFGLLFMLSAVLVLFGSGTVAVADNLASSIGKSISDNYPYVYAFVGSFLILIFGIFSLVLGVSLWQLKKWVPVGLYIFALLNFVSSIGIAPQSITSMLFSLFIAWLGYSLSTRGKLLLK